MACPDAFSNALREIAERVVASRGPVRPLSPQAVILRDNAGALECRRARSTGLLVTLYDCKAGGLDQDAGRYATVCEPHGGIVYHSSRKTAQSWMAEPVGWCPGCQDIRDGKATET